MLERTGGGQLPETASRERYLEAIYVLSTEGETVIAARICDYLGLSAPTVSQTLHRMERQGIIATSDERQIRLTDAGFDLAERIVRRHRLLERWLTDALGLDWATAHEEAGRLEHGVSPLVEEQLARSLGYPKTCPHGNPIPGFGELTSGGLPLSEVPAGGEVEVERILERVEDVRPLLEFLGANGLVPGARLRVLESSAFSGVVVSRDGQTIPVAKDVASMIWVRSVTSPA
jgi:DtxR family Mn-dependent transcriptional regulator